MSPPCACLPLKDKQFYRELKEVTPEALSQLLAKYEWVAQAVRRFQHGVAVFACALTEGGSVHKQETTRSCCEENSCAEDCSADGSNAGDAGDASDGGSFLGILTQHLAILNIPLKLINFQPEVSTESIWME